MSTSHESTLQRAVKLTTQLTRGDRITVDGLGSFAVLRAEPYGSKALIRLAWDGLAVIAPREARWQVITPGAPIYLHGYEPCAECDGKGIVFATHPGGEPAWDRRVRRWVTT